MVKKMVSRRSLAQSWTGLSNLPTFCQRQASRSLARKLLKFSFNRSTLHLRQFVTSTFWYLKPLEEYKTVKPYHVNVPQWALPGQLQSNEVSAPYPNIRVSD